MNFSTLITTLETNLTRTTRESKNNTPLLVYTDDTPFNTTYTTTSSTTKTLTDCKQICINHNTTGTIQIYINNKKRRKYTKITLNNLNTITIT